MEVHVYYKGGLTTDKLKALSLPILVCRPILGAPIQALPPPAMPSGGSMIMPSGVMNVAPMMVPPP